MKLSYEDLGRLEASLFERLSSGKIDVQTYVREWDDIVSFAGWTWDEVATEIDARWTRLTVVPQPAFLC